MIKNVRAGPDLPAGGEAGGIDRVVLVGGLCRHVAGVLEGAGVDVAWHEGLDNRGVGNVVGDIVEFVYRGVGEVVVLVKASRGIGLERVMEALTMKENYI